MRHKRCGGNAHRKSSCKLIGLPGGNTDRPASKPCRGAGRPIMSNAPDDRDPADADNGNDPDAASNLPSDEPDSGNDEDRDAASDPSDAPVAPRQAEPSEPLDDESRVAEGELPNSATPPGDHADLVRRAQAGDRSALNDLIRKFISVVFAIAMRVLGHRQDAEEVVQFVMLIVAGKIEQVDDPDKFPGWIKTIAHRAALAFRRKQGQRPGASELHDNIASPEDALMERNFDEPSPDAKVEKIIQEFAKGTGKRNRDKTVRRLRVILACESYREAAEILGCSEGSARATHHKLVVWGRSHCLEYMWDEDDKSLGAIAERLAARGAHTLSFVMDKSVWSAALQQVNDLEKYDGREFFVAVVCRYRQLGGHIDSKAVN